MSRDHCSEEKRPFSVNIEGEIYRWEDETISTEEIAATGGWDVSLGVQEIDLRTNETRTLEPGEIVTIKPGRGFAKKLKWQRG